jgi:uncharacterized membrane protein YdjX (TVP38/TMEM64 family)
MVHLETAPFWVVFLAIALLPMLGLPAAPFFILAGVLWGQAAGIGWSLLASIICMSLSYLLGKTILRPPLQKLLRKRSWDIPKVDRDDALTAVFICRIAPGVPFAVQNYALAMTNIPFLTYLLGSIPIVFGFTCAFVIMGEALFEGSAGMLVLGAMLFIVMFLVIRLARKRLINNKEPEQPEAQPATEAPH